MQQQKNILKKWLTGGQKYGKTILQTKQMRKEGIKMSMWNPTLVETSLNLRIERGHEAKDYKLSGNVAQSQLKFAPDFICNCEDMEGCNSEEYDNALEDYVRVAATDDHQGRGVSCWVKRCYAVKKIFAMNAPHFMHVLITNDAGIKVNLLILRILVSDSGIADFKARYAQWQKAMRYLDSLADNPNIVMVGDWNHGVIADTKSYRGKSRQYFNFQMIEKSLLHRNIRMINIPGYSFKGFMTIDHLAVSSLISAKNARYEDVHGTDVPEIGTPDHSFIVSELRMCG